MRPAAAHGSPAAKAVVRVVGRPPARALGPAKARAVVAAQSRRVLATARAAGSRPGPTGRRTRTVGLVVADIADPSVAAVVRGIGDTLEGHGLIPVIVETRDHHARTRRVFDLVVGGHVDAVITTATRAGDRALVEEVARRVPTVVALRTVLPDGLTTVACDDDAGAALVARHFADLGHRRVAQLCGPPDVANYLLRRDGFATAAQHAGLRVLEIPECADAPTMAEGRRLMIALLQRHPQPPTAVFAHSDQMAFGALAALRTYGISCPADLSLVGYGDSPPAPLVHPALCSVRLPGYELGCRAAEAVILLLTRRMTEPVRVWLRPLLVTRGSSGVPPRAHGPGAGRDGGRGRWP